MLSKILKKIEKKYFLKKLSQTNSLNNFFLFFESNILTTIFELIRLNNDYSGVENFLLFVISKFMNIMNFVICKKNSQ